MRVEVLKFVLPVVCFFGVQLLCVLPPTSPNKNRRLDVSIYTAILDWGVRGLTVIDFSGNLAGLFLQPLGLAFKI